MASIFHGALRRCYALNHRDIGLRKRWWPDIEAGQVMLVLLKHPHCCSSEHKKSNLIPAKWL